MRISDESIRRQIEACGRREHGRRFTAEVREQVAAHARTEIGSGRSRRSIANAIGIPDQTLARWLVGGAFVPVEIEGEALLGSIVVTSPGGWRIEGLKLEQIAELLRRVS